MEVIANTIKSITAQNLLGWLIIITIVVIFGIGLFFSLMTSKYYKELLDDFNDNREDGYEFSEISRIVERFKASTVSGTDNINTQVIIEKNLNKSKIKYESIAKFIPSTLIALGLLGTFLGLTLAIFETKGALSGIESINNFAKELQTPIASMSTAFWTSIFGVLTSMILNYINRGMKINKDEFYIELEDYLDNEIFAGHAKTFNTIFEEFSKTVKITMLTLTEEMTNLFKDGVEELVSKINTSSIDLTESANGLKEYTKEFKDLVETFDNTVHKFEEPVSRFNDSVKDYIITSEHLSGNVERGFENFVDSANKLDKSMINLTSNIDNSFEGMSRALDISLDNFTGNLGQCLSNVTVGVENSVRNLNNELDLGFTRLSGSLDMNAKANLEVAQVVKDQIVEITDNQVNIKDLIDDVRRHNEKQYKEIEYQKISLSSQTKSLEECIRNFNKSTDHMPLYVAEKFSGVLRHYLDDVGISIKKHIDDNMGSIKTDIIGASKTLDETIQVIDSSREIINSTNRRNSLGRNK
ncbi:MAG: hypothetical protein ACRCYE_05200 [Sarcina sp.]